MRGEVPCLIHEVMMPCVAVERSSTLSREPNQYSMTSRVLTSTADVTGFCRSRDLTAVFLTAQRIISYQ